MLGLLDRGPYLAIRKEGPVRGPGLQCYDTAVLHEPGKRELHMAHVGPRAPVFESQKQLRMLTEPYTFADAYACLCDKHIIKARQVKTVNWLHSHLALLLNWHQHQHKGVMHMSSGEYYTVVQYIEGPSNGCCTSEVIFQCLTNRYIFFRAAFVDVELLPLYKR